MSGELVGTIDITITEEIRPNLDEVGALLRARTYVDGQEVGTFDATTTPTGEQVNDYVDHALDEVRLRLPDTLPAKVQNFVRRLVAMRAGMFIELAYAPEQLDEDATAYARLKEQFDEGLVALSSVGAISRTSAMRSVTLTTPYSPDPAVTELV